MNRLRGLVLDVDNRYNRAKASSPNHRKGCACRRTFINRIRLRPVLNVYKLSGKVARLSKKSDIVLEEQWRAAHIIERAC